MQPITLVAPYNGVNHFATILAYCKITYERKRLTLLVEINASLDDPISSKRDCKSLASLCFDSGITIEFADEFQYNRQRYKISESILNIPNQAKSNFPILWEEIFSGFGKKVITGDSIGIPVITRNPIANIISVYLECLKASFGIYGSRVKYFFARELCPPLLMPSGPKFGSLISTFNLLQRYYVARRLEIIESNSYSINNFITSKSERRCNDFERVNFLLLTNNQAYNTRILDGLARLAAYRDTFIFIIPHPKAPFCAPVPDNMSIVNTRGICAEIIVDLITYNVKIDPSCITVLASSSALITFARNGTYSCYLIKSHLNPLTSKTDFFRYVRLLNFERLCNKVSR